MESHDGDDDVHQNNACQMGPWKGQDKLYRSGKSPLAGNSGPVRL